MFSSWTQFACLLFISAVADFLGDTLLDCVSHVDVSMCALEKVPGRSLHRNLRGMHRVSLCRIRLRVHLSIVSFPEQWSQCEPVLLSDLWCNQVSTESIPGVPCQDMLLIYLHLLLLPRKKDMVRRGETSADHLPTGRVICLFSETEIQLSILANSTRFHTHSIFTLSMFLFIYCHAYCDPLNRYTPMHL